MLQAHSGAEALEISRQYNDQIDLLLADIMMPGMTGIDLAERITLERPEIKIVLMSGYNQGWILDPHWSFLPKPFTSDTLVSRIGQVLAV